MSTKNKINIYINLILIIIIITIIILWESFPARVCCPGAGVCVSGGEQELVKTFTAWKILASLENTGSGTGGCSLLRITAVSGAVQGDILILE